MELTKKKQAIKDRREYVYNAYKNRPADLAVTSLVKALAAKYKLTDVQIYNDIRIMKLINKKSV